MPLCWMSQFGLYIERHFAECRGAFCPKSSSNQQPHNTQQNCDILYNNIYRFILFQNI